MAKIVQYLWGVKYYVIAVILLLMVQAYCDLSLPQYTSNIVDVGIQQGGIEDAVMSQMREETYQTLLLFMTEEDAALVSEHYRQNADGIYVYEAEQISREDRAALNEALSSSIMYVYALRYYAAASGTEISAGQMTPELSEQLMTQVSEQTEELSAVLQTQAAVEFVKAEYEEIGVDTARLQTDYLVRTGVKMLALSILMLAAAVCTGFLSAKAGAKIGMNLRKRVFYKVVSFSNAEINRFSTASLITRSTNDIQQVQMVCVILLRLVFYAPVIGIGGILKVTSTKTGLGWIVAVAVGLIFVLVAVLVGVAMPKFKKMQVLVDNVNRVSREILTGLSVIRAFSRERLEEERFDRANQELKQTQLFTNRVMTIMMPAMMLIMNAISIAIVWFGAQGIDLGRMQVGDMIAFITYTMQIVMAFLMLTVVSVMLPRAGVAADRIQEVIDTELTIFDKEACRDTALSGNGVLEFHDVTFAYPQADEPALEHISFRAEPGKTTAIIGSTGCGKSTLLQLIPRLYDVTGGSITLDGVDIRDISQHKLREYLGYVPQKGFLFSGNISSNIKFGGSWITDEAMKEAAEISQAAEFIEAKPEGYGSPIAQGGSNVSGGQKQRLSIARAIAKQPKLFLFDDSFSALDYKTDAALRKELKERISDSTVLIVAQRISTILHADLILVMEEGKIVGRGTHEELLASCRTYQDIARSQLSEEELEKVRPGGEA